MSKNGFITYHKIKEYFMDRVRENVNADFAGMIPPESSEVLPDDICDFINMLV